VNAKKKNWNNTGTLLEQHSHRYWNNTLTEKKNVCASRNTKCNENILEKRESDSIFGPERISFFFVEKEKN